MRESAQSWRELLVDVKRRGLEIAPDLAVGDGALGFWKAIEEIFPGTRHQRCWVHKTANVLNKVALSVQVNMKADLREIYGASTRAAAEAAIDVFADKYAARYEKAVACLTKDREALLAFFDFPAEHWDHLRTSNPIESVFATVRHRTVRTKGALSAKTAKLMVFKLVTAAAKTWRRLNGENQLPKVVQGIKFQNGIEVIEMPAHHAADRPRHPISRIAPPTQPQEVPKCLLEAVCGDSTCRLSQPPACAKRQRSSKPWPKPKRMQYGPIRLKPPKIVSTMSGWLFLLLVGRGLLWRASLGRIPQATLPD